MLCTRLPLCGSSVVTDKNRELSRGTKHPEGGIAGACGTDAHLHTTSVWLCVIDRSHYKPRHKHVNGARTHRHRDWDASRNCFQTSLPKHQTTSMLFVCVRVRVCAGTQAKHVVLSVTEECRTKFTKSCVACSPKLIILNKVKARPPPPSAQN